MGNMTRAVGGLLIANVVFFFLKQLLANPNPEFFHPMVLRFGLWFPQNDNFELWQFVTSMFMHGGFTHIFFNMFALYMFGTPLEIMWGTRRFLFFYFVAGIGAGVIFTAVNWFEFQAIKANLADAGVSDSVIRAWLRTNWFAADQFSEAVNSWMYELRDIYHAPVVGASGAIYGVLVAFGLTFPNAKLMLIFLPVPIAAKYFIPALVAIDLLSGVTGFSVFGFGARVAHFAHVGGAVIGFLLMWYWRKKLKPVPPPIEPVT